MSETERDFFSSKLVMGDGIAKLKKVKKSRNITEKIPVHLREEREATGWKTETRGNWKKFLLAIKEKTHNDYFEDSVWCLFADMGFKYLNLDNKFKIPYGRDINDNSSKKQIDVFAADDESVFLIECKATTDKNKKNSFKLDIEAIIGYRRQMIQNIKSAYPEFAEHNFKIIFATDNYLIGKSDSDRMKEAGIYHLNSESVKYYKELVSHIGEAARYQFMANIFKGKSVKLKIAIPAICGKMGGKTYYSFAIEPIKLLKISRILHKNIKPDDRDRTYQRIVKKNRLNEIRQFINEGGYFPNALLVNISSKHASKFKEVEKSFQPADSKTRLGMLELPNEYGCAYIIDGQHRLYSYIGTKYAETNTVPVILFEGLDGTEQVKLFMEINEKQKSVPKNLQHVLNADLLWDDKDANNRLTALKLHIAQKLGDSDNSPLFNLVNQGEESTADGRYITIDIIKGALDASCFFNKYRNNKPFEYGVLDRGNNEETCRTVLDFLIVGMMYLYERCSREWDIEEKGFFVSNRGVGALLRVLSDVALTVKRNGTELLYCRPDAYKRQVEHYLSPLAEYFANITPEIREQLETRYGSKYGAGAPTKYWRSLQRVIKDQRDDFYTKGLEEYEASKELKYNADTKEILDQILEKMQDICACVMNTNCGSGDAWVMKGGMTLQTYQACQNKAQKYKLENSQELPIERFLSFEEIKNVAAHKDNWTKSFQKILTLTEPLYAKGSKQQKLAWLERLSEVRKRINKKISVSQEDYDFIVRLKNNWNPVI